MTDTTGHNDGRTAQEVREYLLTHLNDALRRPGMYGGEAALRLYLDAVAFAADAEQEWQEELKDLQTRRGPSSSGVRGAFQDLWGDAHEGAVASVYAEIAHRQGWLRLDRTLTSAEYDEIRRISESWCREDRLLSDVVTRFGPPSILFGGTTPTTPRSWPTRPAGVTTPCSASTSGTASSRVRARRQPPSMPSPFSGPSGTAAPC
ncbi:hypothetical protein ACFWAP_10990 [Streptomyces goshikiensis]|uniref:hypothetical protein n=1 Tax=Streptomyces goshikiensis TaxID=1942 RepID=UPI00365D6D2D